MFSEVGHGKDFDHIYLPLEKECILFSGTNIRDKKSILFCHECLCNQYSIHSIRIFLSKWHLFNYVFVTLGLYAYIFMNVL